MISCSCLKDAVKLPFLLCLFLSAKWPLSHSSPLPPSLNCTFLTGEHDAVFTLNFHRAWDDVLWKPSERAGTWGIRQTIGFEELSWFSLPTFNSWVHILCVCAVSQKGLVRNVCSIHPTVLMWYPSPTFLSPFVCLFVFLQDLLFLSGIASSVAHCKERCEKSQGKVT